MSDSVTPQTIANQAPLSMRFVHEICPILEWVAISFSWDLLHLGIKPVSPALQADLPLNHQRSHIFLLDEFNTGKAENFLN